MKSDRTAEWFVPKWGPQGFRVIVGLLFLPYTGMVLSFVIVGSMLAPTIHWDRLIAGVVIYFLGLGIAAHALDAVGSRKVKPWGEYFTIRQLWTLSICSLVLAYGLALYYIIRHVPLLAVIAILEGFFLFAYNLEWFKGRFHTDSWFAFSWGFLPTLAGYVFQTNQISWPPLVMGTAMACLSLVEISASRPYKELKRTSTADHSERQSIDMPQYERILKGISLGVCLLGISLLLWRLS